jgi:6-pyruvoyl-tetrahydropterin synthase
MKTTKDTADIKEITEALDLSELPTKEQEEILVDINDLVVKGTIIRILERMDEKNKNDFAEFLNTNPSGEEIANFIDAHVSNADEIVQETITDFANDILAVIKE